MTAKDSLFANPLGDIEHFRFNQAVVDVFPDMLKRSVPGYESIITQSALLASRFAQPHTHLYDLGSSLGATAVSMRNALEDCAPDKTEGCEIHAIDNSPAMVKACRKLINASTQKTVPVIVHEADLETFPLANSSVVAMNFTLQFVDPAAREALMSRIAKALIRAVHSFLAKRCVSPILWLTSCTLTCTTLSNKPTDTRRWRSARNARRWKTCWYQTPCRLIRNVCCEPGLRMPVSGFNASTLRHSSPLNDSC